MKRGLLIIAVVIQMVIGQGVQAGTIAFGDNTVHWAGYPSAYAPYNTDDSINMPDYSGGFATTGPGGVLNRIDFIDVPLNHTPPNAYNQYLLAGDLFIDTKADGIWDYVVKSIGTYGHQGAQSVELFNVSALNVSTNVSDAGQYSYVVPGQGRDGQPIGLLSTAGATDLGAVTYSGYYNGNNYSYSVYFDFGALAIDLLNSDFIVGYSPDCANDVILEKVPVPEPGTMVLFGIGMLGMAIFGKRRMNKNS